MRMRGIRLMTSAMHEYECLSAPATSDMSNERVKNAFNGSMAFLLQSMRYVSMGHKHDGHGTHSVAKLDWKLLQAAFRLLPQSAHMM